MSCSVVINVNAWNAHLIPRFKFGDRLTDLGDNPRKISAQGIYTFVRATVECSLTSRESVDFAIQIQNIVPITICKNNSLVM